MKNLRFRNILRRIAPEKMLENRQFYFNKYPYESYKIKYRCILIHIPKTGGTSILKMLSDKTKGRNHSDWMFYYNRNPKAFNNYFKFAFVRDPYDRAVSCYKYLANGGNKNEDLYYQNLILTKYDTFEKFVMNYLDISKIYENVLLKPQYMFLYDNRENCKVDFIGYFENLSRDISYVKQKLKITNELPEINKTSKKNEIDYYVNKDVRKKIFELYKKDFFIFNYQE